MAIERDMLRSRGKQETDESPKKDKQEQKQRGWVWKTFLGLFRGKISQKRFIKSEESPESARLIKIINFFNYGNTSGDR